LLSVNNADKGAKPAAFDKRLAMMWAFARDVQRSLQENSGDEQASSEVETLSVDLGLSTVPYFHEKSAVLAEGDFYDGERDMGGRAETEQVFLVGYDTLIRIFNPKYYGPLDSEGQVSNSGSPPIRKALDPFFTRARLRVTMRTGDEWGGADEQTAYLEGLFRAGGLSNMGGSTDWDSRIQMVEEPKLGDSDAISSTYARAAAKDRDSGKLDLMVTSEVRWRIEQESLYSE
jgi:nicotinamide-nucleotide adenylyltransferase